MQIHHKSSIAAASPLAAGNWCSGAHVGKEPFPGHVAVRMEQRKPSGRWVLLLHLPSASQVIPIHATCPTAPHQELQCSTTEQAQVRAFGETGTVPFFPIEGKDTVTLF